MNKITRKFKKTVTALAVTSCLSVLPAWVQAAGLGKLTVLSGLGQPFRAEVEMSVKPEELVSMSARLASSAAFQQAGLEYLAAYRGLRFTIDRSKTKPTIKISSNDPMNEPFLDFLLELSWASGRLVREYTFLLDPPGTPVATVQQSKTGDGAAQLPVAAGKQITQTKGEMPSQASTASRQTGSVAAETKKPSQQPKSTEAPPSTTSEAPRSTGDGHLVIQGETLRKIAQEYLYKEVTLEQMLVAIYQANPKAFSDANINRLRAGALLKIPPQETAAAVSKTDARKIYVQHAADWNAYRQKLAATTKQGAAREDTAGQTSSGKVTERVQEKKPSAELTQDQVKISATESGKAGAKASQAAKANASTEDSIARDRALKEAEDRLQSLEKNVLDLQKLLSLKNEQLAGLQQQIETKTTAPVSALSPPAIAVPPATTVTKAAEAPPPAPKPAEAATVTEMKPAEAVTPAAEAPAAAKPTEPPAPPPTPKPAVHQVAVDDAMSTEEPSFFEDMLLPLVGGLVVLVLGVFAYLRRRRTDHSSDSTLQSNSSLLDTGDSALSVPGFTTANTGNVSPTSHNADAFSHTGEGSLDAEEVDPVAEADVYIAYGRDTHAEEILLDALQKNPDRTAIHRKLLEIYALRGSIKQFENLATELYSQTHGTGPDWASVAETGRKIDPKNPLYVGEHADFSTSILTPNVSALSDSIHSGVSSFPDAPLEEENIFSLNLPQEKARNSESERKADSFFATSMTAPSAESPLPALVDKKKPEPIDASKALDFDLDLSESSSAIAEVESSDENAMLSHLTLSSFSTAVSPPSQAFEPPPATVESSDENAMLSHLTLSSFSTAVSPPSQAFEPPPEEPPAPAKEPTTPTVATKEKDDGVDMNIALTESVFLGTSIVSPDFTDINLELGDVDLGGEVASPPPQPVQGSLMADIDLMGEGDEHLEEAKTKLELAKAYEEMGDPDGARELLQELIANAPESIAKVARDMISRLG